MTRAILLAAALVLPLSAHAQPAATAAPVPATAGFLVMDSERLATEATAMKSVFDQMAKRRDTEAAAYNLALDKLDQEFEPIRQSGATMAEDDYQKALKRYNEIKAQIDGVLKDAQESMNAAAEKAIQQFNTVATVVGQQVRQDHGVSRFVDGAAVLYVRPGSGYDATDEVIRRVNAKLPDIKVDFPEREKAEAQTPAKPAAKQK
ncbi:MAG: OmpH family outer membrane protein [Sphingomonadales bacterium]